MTLPGSVSHTFRILSVPVHGVGRTIPFLGGAKWTRNVFMFIVSLSPLSPSSTWTASSRAARRRRDPRCSEQPRAVDPPPGHQTYEEAVEANIVDEVRRAWTARAKQSALLCASVGESEAMHRQKYIDVWICFETDSSRKPSLDELSTSKDFEMCSKRVGRSTFRFTTETRFFRITFDTYAYIPRADVGDVEARSPRD